MKKLIKRIAKLLTLFIFDKVKRRKERALIERKLITKYYGANVLKRAKYIGVGFKCNGFSKCSGNTFLGDYVNFNGMTITGGGQCKIGNYFHSGTECLILTQNHNYDNGIMIPYDTTSVYKKVEIGDFVWLGSRVTILPGTKIGEGAIIQAGAVVHGEIPDYAIAGGNPAKVFKYRDIEHFKALKEKGAFVDLCNVDKNVKSVATVERERERERVISLMAYKEDKFRKVA